MSVCMEPGNLIRCDHCALRYRSPVWHEDDLTRLYECLPDNVWEGRDSEVERPYWLVIQELLSTFASGRSILDVGCYAGDFLNWLPEDWKKYGIEPGKKASNLAASRGITMIGRTAADLEKEDRLFDVIVSFDVIEHLTQPLLFMQRLGRSLKPGGCLVILTGATESWPYRLFGRHYWYGSIPEHVTFYSQAWFQWVAREMGMNVAYHRFLSSERRIWSLWFRQFAQISLSSVVRIALEKGIRSEHLKTIPFLRKIVNWRVVPWWKQASDHGLVVLTFPGRK
jgi:SAM-dependent methyltransferase